MANATEMDLPFVVDLELEIPTTMSADFLAKLWYVAEDIDDFRLSDDRRRVHYRLRGATADARSEAVASGIKETATRMCAGFRSGEIRTIVDRRVGVPFSADPHPVLEASGELHRVGSGRYALGPIMAGLVHFFRESLDALSGRFGATRRQFPTLIGADVLTRCRYIQTFPHSLTLVTHLREDLSCIQKFSRESRWDGQELAFDHDALASVECLLSSSVCFHHYAWIAGSKLTDGQCVTAVGKCFRFESGNLSGLERLWDFTMHEIIFVGSGEFVTGERQRGIDEVTALLDRWGLAYRICTATDPFFIDGYSTQTAFQSAFELKYEIRADLPYKGPDASLAVGSLNYHQDFFGRSFDIDCASAPAHTGCIAFGLERLALAFVAQYGTDKSRWPTDVARNVP